MAAALAVCGRQILRGLRFPKIFFRKKNPCKIIKFEFKNTRCWKYPCVSEYICVTLQGILMQRS